MRHKQYKRKTVDRYVLDAWRIAFVAVGLVLVVNLLKAPHEGGPDEFINPLAAETSVCAGEVKIVEVEKQNVDTWIRKYAKKDYRSL